MGKKMRDSEGRFKKGNPGGPGRPPRQVEVAKELGYLGATLDAVSEDDWVAIVEKAVEQAIEGDGRARDWLAAILVAEDLAQVRQWKEAAEKLAELEEGMSLAA